MQFAQIDPLDIGRLVAWRTARFARPAREFGMLLSDPVFWGWGVPRGDGHAVLVLPGYGGGDAYLQPLRGWLRRVGYVTIRSGLDVNLGWSEELVSELGELVSEVFARSGSKLTIIGHSLGGLFAYSIAVRQPKMVRQLITLASPLRLIRPRLPASVPLTSLYSRSDPVVRYPAALALDNHARNLEVGSSHIGMAAHPEVYRRIGAILAQKS
jgi:pimeloyl-ACP methyl ester carboxylesterase